MKLKTNIPRYIRFTSADVVASVILYIKLKMPTEFQISPNIEANFGMDGFMELDRLVLSINSEGRGQRQIVWQATSWNGYMEYPEVKSLQDFLGLITDQPITVYNVTEDGQGIVHSAKIDPGADFIMVGCNKVSKAKLKEVYEAAFPQKA